ncbi:hypothetical protein [Blautia sp.]
MQIAGMIFQTHSRVSLTESGKFSV